MIVLSKTFLIQYFGSLCKYTKRKWVSTLLSCEMYGLYIGQGFTLNNIWKIIRCSIKYFEQCNWLVKYLHVHKSVK